jgi:hypothetical protein
MANVNITPFNSGKSRSAMKTATRTPRGRGKEPTRTRTWLDFVIDNFAPGSGRIELRGSGAVFGPNLIELTGDRTLEQIAGFLRLGPIVGQHTVK